MVHEEQPFEQIQQVLPLIGGANLAFVGGGVFCLTLIRLFRDSKWKLPKPNIVAVADKNPEAVGFQLARKLELFTTTDYRDLYRMPGLQVIMEITHDPDLSRNIALNRPKHIYFIDHFHARYLWDSIQVENIKQHVLELFQLRKRDPQAVEKLFIENFDRFGSIIGRRNARSRQIEIELAANQRTQAQIIQGSTIPTFVIDKNHIVTHWNKALEKLSGWSADKVVGTNLQWAPFWESERPSMADVILMQLDDEKIQNLYGRQWRKSVLIEEGFEAEVFFPKLGPSGKWIWFTAAPLKASDGTITGAIETLWDKTDERGAEIEKSLLQEQVIKSEEKYRSLFENDPNPIFIIDPRQLEIIDINERARICYGYSRAELIGMPFLNLGDPEDQEVRKALTHLDMAESVLFTKKRHFRGNHASFFVNINVSHARYGESDVLIATTTDITETVEKETQLIQAGKMTTLGLMAAGMAHEINQPLNVIQLYTDLFLKSLNKGIPLADEALRTMVKEITENVQRATGIIRHVRDFARQSEVIKNRIDINAPVRDVFKVLGNQIKVHQIELHLNLTPDLPAVMADHNRLEQVFINLVTNAIDAMDEKAELPAYQGMVKRLVISTFAEEDKVVVIVEDSGIGMSDTVKAKIFEPFFTTKKVGKGTGLGVSISYGIIKDYDGTIDIQSEAQHGTRFIIKFPMAPGSGVKTS